MAPNDFSPRYHSSKGRAVATKVELPYVDDIKAMYHVYKTWSNWYTTSLLATIRTNEPLTEEQRLHRWFCLYMVVVFAMYKRFHRKPTFQRWAHIDTRAYQHEKRMCTGYEMMVERIIDLHYRIKHQCPQGDPRIGKKYTSKPPIQQILSLEPRWKDGKYDWYPEQQAVRSIIYGYGMSLSRIDNAIILRWRGVAVPQHRQFSKKIPRKKYPYTFNPTIDPAEYKCQWLLTRFDNDLVGALEHWIEQQNPYPSPAAIIGKYMMLLRVWATNDLMNAYYYDEAEDDFLLESVTADDRFENFAHDMADMLKFLKKARNRLNGQH